MAAGVPELSRDDIREHLQKLCARAQQGRHLFAFHGRGEDDSVDIDGFGRFDIVSVRSELDLRAKMPALEEENPKVAFLVPWATEIPIDLAGRFSRNGRVERIGREARLKRLFGATELDDGVVQSRLSEHLLATAHAGQFSSTSGRLTVDAMWTCWLRGRWGIETPGGLGLDALLAWGARDNRGSEFRRAAEQTPGLRDELMDYLERSLGEAGPVTWKAWERDAGEALLQWAVLFEALADRPEASARAWTKLTVTSELGVDDPTVAERVAKQLGGACSVALRSLEQRSGAAFVRALVTGADDGVKLPEVRELLITSPRLPSGWRLRLAALGRKLEAAVAEDKPSAQAVSEATAALRELESHSQFTEAEQTRTAKRAEMAVRLLAWLSAKPHAHLNTPQTPYGDAEALGRWYAEEGGYVDWARRVARGTTDDELGRGVAAVVARADGERKELDRRFARALKAWVEARRPSSQVVPIDQAIKRVAVRFLHKEEARRLLVLLVDGMAWAQAVEILQSMAERATPWGPIAWHASSAGRVGEGVYPTVFANLPSVTEVSRAAFFAGKPMTPGATLSTSGDPDWWQKHREVAKLFEPPDHARLLLRAEGHTGDGSASSEALSLVADERRRVVAIVINAIDASLKGDTQLRHAWTVDSIGSLPDLLDKAREAGRTVLLAADHGHVPGDLLEHKGSYAGGGARHRPWQDPADPVEGYEVGLHGEGVYAPKGAHGVILLTDDTTRYGGGAHAGEHGGASLAEVVAPCLLIGADEATGVEDPDLRVKPAYVPPWWHFDLKSYEVSDQEQFATPSKKTRKEPESKQLELSVGSAPPAQPPIRRPTPAKAWKPGPSVLDDNAILTARAPKATVRKQVIAAVALLLDRGGVMSAAAFASALGQPGWRAGPFIAVLQEVLNVDAYDVLQYDRKGQQVMLNRGMLETQFEVKL